MLPPLRKISIDNIDEINRIRAFLQSLIERTPYQIEIHERDDFFQISNNNKGNSFYLNYHFTIDLNKSQQELVGILEYFPSSTDLKKAVIRTEEISKIEEAFESWITIFEMYESRSFSRKENGLEEYKKEFYNEYFEPIEEDRFLTFDQQKAVYLFLTLVKDRIGKENFEGKNEIVDKIDETKNNLGKLKLSQVRKNIADTISLIRYYSSDLLYKIMDVLQKEMMKKMISGPLDDFTSWISNL